MGQSSGAHEFIFLQEWQRCWAEFVLPFNEYLTDRCNRLVFHFAFILDYSLVFFFLLINLFIIKIIYLKPSEDVCLLSQNLFKVNHLGSIQTSVPSSITRTKNNTIFQIVSKYLHINIQSIMVFIIFDLILEEELF